MFETANAWMRGNLTTQGFHLTDSQRRDLAVALRFSTALCFGLVSIALILGSAALVFFLSGIGLVAGFASNHPFDHLWNRVVRHIVGGPSLPANPRRRRDAFKVGTAWLVVVGALILTGEMTAAYLLGAVLLLACATVTTTNLCLPSETFAWLERRRARHQTTTT